ncbi:MAG TPA: carbohydrate binding domain-containing protein [Chthoniobacteraceae bacterium]|nr:carbohydrate binding domain-containing protein [Chthoniobacteraceae bacterium]
MLLRLAFLLLAAAGASAAEMFPFVLPWDDASPSITNLSPWLEKPAGREGFVTVKDGHLFANGKRLRIFGVNVAFGANFPTHADAEKVAARMAKFGINCVRFHHMDMQAAPGGIWARDMKTLDPEQLDRLDYFIAELKKNGIYADLNLHVSRTYPDRPREEKAGNSDYDKGVDNFCAAMIALQKDYARDLLTHRNPYTGTAYIDEPAVALIEINNENALLHEWQNGGLDRAAAPYREELSRLWQQWIGAKYKSKDELRAAWAKGAQQAGPEMLKNGSFAAKLEAWYLERHEGAEATAEVGQIEGAHPDPTHVNGAPRVRIAVTKPGKEPWHVQFVQGGLKVEGGRSYTLEFRAKADAPCSVRASASQAHEPWTVFDSKAIDLTREWKSFRFTFRAKENDVNARIALTSLGSQTGVFDFSDVRLSTSAISGEPLLSSDGQLVALSRDDYAARTETAQRDWFAFLWSLEEKYWPEMYEFIRKDLGAKSLIVGTQLGWSPFPIQSHMDVIDSHAYWQHPHFPGRAWDMNDWTVKNLPMAGREDGGTLPGLALQRVAGKPYICTEYNHSAPNEFASETFPLICAYAALQDWDGVFAFAYSHRRDDWNKGCFPSFFDIDQHPTKMATLPASLAIFLRGDVRAAGGAVNAGISREQAIDAARATGPRVGADKFGVDRLTTFAHRVGVHIAAGAGPLYTKLIGRQTTSDTGEVTWDIENHLAVVDCPKTKGVAGEIRMRIFKLGNVTIAPQNGTRWATIHASVIDGNDFKSARRILITATGKAVNTDMKWKNDAHDSVGRDWGRAPSLVEGIAAKMTLPSSKLKAWALDERGQRREEVPMTNGLLEIDPQYRTLWYEVATE